MPKTWYEEHQERQYEASWQAEKSKLPIFDSFKAYYAAHPEYKAHPDVIQMELERDKSGQQFFAPGDGCMDGEYIHCFIRSDLDPVQNKIHFVVVNDGDDSYFCKACESLEAAKKELQELVKLVPFHGKELLAFGYDYE